MRLNRNSRGVIQNPVEHLRWRFLRKTVNGFQWFSDDKEMSGTSSDNE